MDNKEILSHIDHTLLKPTATWPEIKILCEEAINYQTASVCIPPTFVKRIHHTFGNQVNICTVIGFPLGYFSTEVKLSEVLAAKEDGCTEFDMVVNLGDVKDGLFNKITEEICTLKNAVGDLILKVIVETCYLTENEKIALCHCVTEGGADFIKTSTGFGPFGATIEDIRLFKKHIGPSVRIKAAGGIKLKEDIERYIHEGCERIGSSSAVSLYKYEK